MCDSDDQAELNESPEVILINKDLVENMMRYECWHVKTMAKKNDSRYPMIHLISHERFNPLSVTFWRMVRTNMHLKARMIFKRHVNTSILQNCDDNDNDIDEWFNHFGNVRLKLT